MLFLPSCRVVRRLRWSAVVACLLSAVLRPPAAAAQEGGVAGTVVDAESLRPVAGAQVFIPGTVIGTLTGETGTYRLSGVPSGEVTVSVRLIGYKEASQPVEVAPGEIATADFQLEQTALRLQDIVVTGVVAETPRVKLPFTVERLDTDDLPVPASDVSTLLSAKAPGLTVVRATGQPGQPADITLRGPTSIDATGRTQAPLIVIDGVIQSETASLADIGSLDVDHIEIVKGAAGASLYGSRAQNGVIQITTKRGTALASNALEVLIRGEFGFSSLEQSVDLSENHPYVMNEAGTKFLDTNGNEVDYAQFNQDGNGGPQLRSGDPATAFKDGVFPGPLFNQLDRFFDPGETSSLYGAVTGRFGESSFRISFETYSEQGVVDCGEDCRNAVALEEFGDDFRVRDDGYDRQNARLNVDTRFGQVDLAASGFFSRSRQDDGALERSFFDLAFVTPFVDLTEPDEDGLPLVDADPLSNQANPLYSLAVREAQDERSRVMGSIDGVWSPAPWLSLEANASFDRTDFESLELWPKNTKLGSGGAATGGELDKFNFVDEAINASLTASFSETFLGDALTVRAKARYLVEDQDFESNGAFGTRFAVEGVPTFQAQQGEQVGRNNFREIKAQGYFGIASLDYRGRYIVDGLVRRDGSSLFGPDERWHTYYRGSVAWRPSQETWWNLEWWDELKLRFSYGTAGGRPNFLAQFETFGVTAGQIFPINLGNRALKPEFSAEREAGVNLVLLGNLGIDYTYAWATTDDQLLLVPQPAFVGYSAQWQNAGEISSHTHEVSVRWAALDREELGLDFRVGWDRTRQQITRLDIPEFVISGFQVAKGEVLGSMWGDRWATTCADVAASVGLFSTDGFDCSAFATNDQGYVVFVGEGNTVEDGIEKGLWGTSGQVAGATFDWGIPIKGRGQSRSCLREHPGDAGIGDRCPLVTRLPLGNTQPDWNGSLATSFRYKGLALNALLEAAVGFEIWNLTRQWPFRDDRGLESDQAGKPDALKKPLTYYQKLYNLNELNSHFVEGASWLKLRELSVGYTLPDSWLSRAFGDRISRISLSLIGRNLLTVTDYSGYDPEVGFENSPVGSATIDRFDGFGYPGFRTITASLDVVF